MIEGKLRDLFAPTIVMSSKKYLSLPTVCLPLLLLGQAAWAQAQPAVPEQQVIVTGSAADRNCG